MAFNPYDRASLISSLRGAVSSGNNSSAQSSPLPMQQSFDDLQQLMHMQQMQMQQPLQFQHQQQHHQQQYQFLQQQQQQQSQQQSQQRFANPAQAQLYAIQQSQIELQLQQIKMANLALQEQILLQHQQQQAQSPPYGNLTYAQQQQQQLGYSGRHPAAAGRAVSASAALPYAPPRAVDAMYTRQPTANVGAYGIGNTANETETELQMSAGARQEARRGALRDLQQARTQREHSPSPSVSTTTISSPPNVEPISSASDWQFQRMQYRAAGTGSDRPASPATVVTPPAQIDSHKRDLVGNYQHRKQDSEMSDASIQSLSFSEAGSQVSPNRGPALILSKPGDEYPEEDAEHAMSGSEDTAEDPMSPTLNASMRAASLRDVLAGGNEQNQNGNKRRSSSSGRHTLILRSSIADLAAQAQRGESSTGRYADSEETSSGTSSPTSDRSEVASFESTASTCATSVPNTSPTSASFDKKMVKDVGVEIKATLPSLPSALLANVAHRRAVSGSAALNPSATTFAPGGSTKSYPSSLSLTPSGSGASTPGSSAPRLFTAPPRAGTPGKGVASIIRQPKGPADEGDMASRNFAGMIRRKAIGALRLASATGPRASPLSSPVLSGFPSGGAFPSDQHYQYADAGGSSIQQRLSSPPSAAYSGTPLTATGNGTFNMSDLATRALRRRSQQGGYAALLGSQGLGVTQ